MRSKMTWLGGRKKNANSGIGRWRKEAKKTMNDKRKQKKGKKAREGNYMKKRTEVKIYRAGVPINLKYWV